MDCGKILLTASFGILHGSHSAIEILPRFCFTTACTVDFVPNGQAFWQTLTFHPWQSFVTICMTTLLGVLLLKMRYISTPVKRLLTLSYFVLQLPICLQTLLQLKVSLCRHLICLTHRPQIRYILKHLLRGSVGVQPRGLQFSFLPSSFNDIWITQDKLPTTCSPLQKLPPPFIKGSSFPPELQFDDGSSSRAQFNTSVDDKRKMKVLVPISPKEYLERLSGIDHPCQLNFSAWGWYPNAINLLKDKTPEEYLRFQARVLNSILSRAKELTSDERKRKPQL